MIDVPIVTSYSGKGIKQASKDLGYLGTGAARLGSTFNKAFGAFAIGAGALAGLKSSVSAFANDQKQIEILNNSLKNMGFNALSQSVDDFISQLALASGVAKSDLIPAYQNFLVSTGSASKAQDALSLAMNVSAGTGKDLQTVTTAMSKAYLGNTTSLTRLGAGLDKTLLKSGDMVQINQRLTDLFQGDASIAANSFSGQMAQLGQAAEAAKVSIGTNLVGALGTLDSKGNGIETLTRLMNDLATAVNIVADGFAGIALSAKYTGIGALIGWVSGGKKTPSMSTAAKGTAGLIPMADSPYGPWSVKGKTDKFIGPTKLSASQISALNAKAAADAKKKKAAADSLATLTKKNALDKANYAILMLSNKFDMQRIELNAALASATDDQTRASIRGQIALLDAQDKLSLGTAAGADAVTKLATSSLTQLTALDQLAKAHADEANKIDTVNKAFTDLGFVAADLAAAFSASAVDMRTHHDSFVGGSGNGIANSNIDNSGTGANGQDTHGGNGAGTSTSAPTIIINTPAVVTSTTVDPIVQAATDALARAGYTSARAAGTNGWQ